jgi:bifunctional DNA-binding transcriptional regulator/antitoxin component of YhaV-PrlF toxin-antitoxin module
MTLDYNRVWTTLNELEMVTSKISSAREILDSAIDALENHNGEKAETLMYAADEFLKYYLADFDVKFKDAWNETVVKIKGEEYTKTVPLSSHNDDSISLGDCMNNSWEEFYYPEEANNTYMSSWEGGENIITFGEEVKEGYEMTADGFWNPPQPSQKEDKVVKWRIPVEMDGPSGEYFVTFPDDLLEAANLNEGDEVEWVDQNDGSFILRKTWNDPYRDDMIAAGFEKVNGVWTKKVEPLGMDEC